MAYVIRPQAKFDIKRAKAERRTAATRRRFTREANAALAAIGRRPRSFPFHPDGGGVVRVAQLATFPHLVLFFEDGDDAVVVALVHARSGPDTLAAAVSRD